MKIVNCNHNRKFKTFWQYLGLRDFLARRIRKRKNNISRIYVSKLAKKSFYIHKINRISIEDYTDKEGLWRMLCVTDKFGSTIFSYGLKKQNERFLIEEWLNISRAWMEYDKYK